jgi:hypothetical protein
MSIDGPNFRLLECWIDQNAAGASHLPADIDYSKLDKWLKEPAWRSYPVAGLRLVVGLQNPSHPHSPFGGAQLWGLTEDFRSDFGACPHPLSMLVKFGQTQTDALVRRIDQLYRGLSESEGQRTSLPDIALLDISTRLAFSEKNRTCCVSLLTFLHQQIQWLRDNSTGKVDPTLMDNLENRLEILSSSVDQLPSYDSLKSLIQSRQDQVCPFGPEPVIPSEA